jgi:hypothetical protein
MALEADGYPADPGARAAAALHDARALCFFPLLLL